MLDSIIACFGLASRLGGCVMAKVILVGEEYVLAWSIDRGILSCRRLFVSGDR